VSGLVGPLSGAIVAGASKRAQLELCEAAKVRWISSELLPLQRFSVRIVHRKFFQKGV
jgi:hypothetical protein